VRSIAASRSAICDVPAINPDNFDGGQVLGKARDCSPAARSTNEDDHSPLGDMSWLTRLQQAGVVIGDALRSRRMQPLFAKEQRQTKFSKFYEQIASSVSD
jgi:hypothetical protein